MFVEFRIGPFNKVCRRGASRCRGGGGGGRGGLVVGGHHRRQIVFEAGEPGENIVVNMLASSCTDAENEGMAVMVAIVVMTRWW